MAEIDQRDVRPLLNALHEGVCCLSAQGELLYWNETAQKHWKLHQQHPNTLLLLPSVTRALAGEHVHDALVQGDEAHTLLLNTLPLHGGTSSITSVMIISQDVNALIAKHGGSLTVTSEGVLGKGSTFIVKLPYR